MKKSNVRRASGLKIKKYNGWFEVYKDGTKITDAHDNLLSLEDLLNILNKNNINFNLEDTKQIGFDVSGI